MSSTASRARAASAASAVRTQRTRFRVATSATVAVLVALSGFAGTSVVVNARAAHLAEQASVVGRGYQELEARLVHLEEHAEAGVDAPHDPVARQSFDSETAAARGVLLELRGADADGRQEVDRALAALDHYGAQVAELLRLVVTDPDRAEEFEESQVDPVFEHLLDIAAGGAHGHVAEAAEHVGRLDRVHSVLLVATPLAFGIGLAAVGLSAAVLRASGRQIQRQAADSRHQARHDALTGLPNRTLLRERAEEAMAAQGLQEPALALLLIDLDRFKEINDTLGHRYGDLVLATVSARLAQAVGPEDTVARLGGDEFAVLLPGRRDVRTAEQVAQVLRAAVEESIDVEGLVLEVEASIGVAVSGLHGDSPEALLRSADLAMYAAKTRGTGVCVYSSDVDGHSPERLGLLSELRRALEAGELQLHYQPKVDLAAGQVRGVEALLRWPHAERGWVPPALFIPMAEHTGLIHPLTRFVIGEALAQSRRWLEDGRSLPVAVNISARNLLDDRFVDDVIALVEAAQVPASYLELELTESAIMTEPARARVALRRLADIGITLSVDDFGAGYTSLAHLKDLPVHQLKIDRSFVSTLIGDASDRAVVRSIVQLGNELGLVVVAEGVEDDPTRRGLVEVGCGVGQGWHFAKAMPAAQLLEWLDSTSELAATT